MHWKKDWYSLRGPLIIWAAFMAITPIILVEAIISLDVFPQHADLLLRIVALICTAAFVPLATLAEIAPPFVTREEVRWRNRNTETLFEGDVVWEDVPFLPPLLNRIRSTTGKRRRREEGNDAPAASATVST
ncbi:hypothetical protein EXN32_21035 [Agrobacterium tumefaciens]|uniref:Uncharacterized protein n=1 Tax=Agrobacterium deltaense Zutra 3/1 TaxID=1183427 RepID=A0A1S7S2K0_9HYPH|nr:MULTISPECIES: hypothetical protein [Agrobacterium]MBW9075599.1 hypothetical protein [Agrobacterium deltaense]MDA5241299.1 hypothetical protein [Agrobacterium sp. MAFF310724]MDA5249415.1 hypothetical protein [Agrobacterium sp. MAFF210268]MDO3445617.1 hypothetical protein [Agrobacterium sp. V1]TRB13135.1 hypothetical protein EXN32_21035 [Agrobacterium tumefaciens]